MRLTPWRRIKQTGVPTMRLYTLTGTTQVKDNSTGKIHEADENGAFDLPEDFGIALHSFHVGGKPAWEDDAERARRITAEQLEKMRDPATMLAEMQKMTAALAGMAASAPPASAPSAPAPVADPASDEAPAEVAKAPAKRTRKATAAAE